jgi:hypothetical protein
MFILNKNVILYSIKTLFFVLFEILSLYKIKDLVVSNGLLTYVMYVKSILIS